MHKGLHESILHNILGKHRASNIVPDAGVQTLLVSLDNLRISALITSQCGGDQFLVCRCCGGEHGGLHRIAHVEWSLMDLLSCLPACFRPHRETRSLLQAVRSFFSIKDRSGQNAGHEASGVSATDVSIHGIHYQAWSPDMSPDEPDRAEKLDVATALADIVSGRHDAADLLMPLVYEEMRGLAQSLLKRESSAHTLQPTALVNEAYLRMADQNRVNWQGKTHFFAIGAKTMRRILVDHARTKKRHKRGGGRHRIELTDDLCVTNRRDEDVLAIEEALEKLVKLDPRQAQIVELRFYGGLTVEEVAEVLGVSKRTVESDWTMVRAWLRRELSSET